MSNEEKLREALAEIAGQASGPARLTAEIAARSRLRRQRRSLLVAAAAAGTAAAAGVGTALRPRRETVATPAPPPAPESPAGPAGTRIPLRYRPSWLPPGFAETSRAATVPGDEPFLQIRTWRRGAGPEDVVKLQVMHRDRVDADEVRAGLWQEAPDGMMLSVTAPRPGDRDRIAASVEPDPSAVCAVSLAFGWVPQRFAGAVRATVDGSAGRWREILRLDGHPGGPTAVEAELVWEVSTAKGSPVTLRGLPGALLIGAASACPDPPGRPDGCGSPSFARVELGGSRLLRVTAGPGYEVSRDELVRIVESMVLGPAPDVTWLPR